MSSKKQVWAIQHIGYEDLGSFESVLKSRGFEVRYLCSRLLDYGDLSASEPDLLVILGGPMSVYDTDNHPWVVDEEQFVSDRIASGQSLMGICFGAQMVAKALGAKVYAGPQGKEIGWFDVTVNDMGMKTPFRYLDGQYTSMMHWHGDTFDMPEGAELLASSEKYKKQAYRYGDHVFCMQCHPEVTEEKLQLWYKSNAEQITEVGTTVTDMQQQAHMHHKKLSEQASLFLNEWLDEQGL